MKIELVIRAFFLTIALGLPTGIVSAAESPEGGQKERRQNEAAKRPVHEATRDQNARHLAVRERHRQERNRINATSGRR